MSAKKSFILIEVAIAIIVILAAVYIFSNWNKNQGANQVTDEVKKKETLVLPTPSKEQLEKAKKNAERMKINIKNPFDEEPKGEGIKEF